MEIFVINFSITFFYLVDMPVPARVHTDYSVHPLVRPFFLKSEQQKIVYRLWVVPDLGEHIMRHF